MSVIPFNILSIKSMQNKINSNKNEKEKSKEKIANTRSESVNNKTRRDLSVETNETYNVTFNRQTKLVDGFDYNVWVNLSLKNKPSNYILVYFKFRLNHKTNIVFLTVQSFQNLYDRINDIIHQHTSDSSNKKP